MEKSIERLHAKKKAVAESCKAVRADIEALCDEKSFVELTAFGFSEGESEEVVTGFATIGGYPFYLVAQNYAVSCGGLTKANCEKISKALSAAERSDTPVIYFLHSQGACVKEGTDVLEGVSELLLKAAQLKGTVLQLAVVCGGVYGSAAALAALCDFVFYTKESSLLLGSPLVASAKEGKTLTPEEVGGYEAGAPLPALRAASVRDAAAQIKAIYELINIPEVDAELNVSAPSLNGGADAAKLLKLFESSVEIGANNSPEVKTVIGRIGGISVAAVVFDKAKIDAANVRKIRDFAELACCYHLPFVTFVDCAGSETSLAAVKTPVLKEIGEYLNILDAVDSPKVSVVTGEAAGLGYSLFAAKSVGFDYSLALATAHISLFGAEEGASIVYKGEAGSKEELSARYLTEHGDPFEAAKSGYLDNVVEPAHIKQHLISVLQMLR